MKEKRLRAQSLTKSGWPSPILRPQRTTTISALINWVLSQMNDRAYPYPDPASLAEGRRHLGRPWEMSSQRSKEAKHAMFSQLTFKSHINYETHSRKTSFLKTVKVCLDVELALSSKPWKAKCAGLQWYHILLQSWPRTSHNSHCHEAADSKRGRLAQSCLRAQS